jgi:hypothetical protein
MTMGIYRCYLCNSGGHIVTTQDLVNCSDEREARRLAITLLNTKSQYCGVSVWEADRKIFAEFIPTRSESGLWPLDRAA